MTEDLTRETGEELKSRIQEELTDIVGPANVSDREEDLLCVSYDATREFYRPSWVVWPESATHVSEVLKLANKFGIPVTPRGAGTGFSGGALPVRGGIVLSLVKMNRIVSVDPDNMLAVVEPGVVTADLDKAAARFGLFYPPDPASLEISTIGGNVAESAGGPRAVKYGVTRDFVLGVEAVLPTGEIIQTGSRTTKCVVGYDLTRLLVGSEGTLAVFTKIFMRLMPKPEGMTTLMVLFPHVRSAARTVSAIIAAKIIPTTLEFMDRSTISCVREEAGMEFPENVGALLLIELDGPLEVLQRQQKAVEEICYNNKAVEVQVAEDEADRSRLWAARRAVSPSLHKVGPDKFNEDIVVPRSKVPDILERIEQIASDHDLNIITFGHAGDGNIHVNIMTDLSESGMEEKVHHAIEAIFRATIELEGSISGEHGVGISKAPFISMELNTSTVQAMKAIKAALDPNNILNPGKMFFDRPDHQTH